MLEIRPVCENCGKKLPNESSEAMICTFECTFCKDCVENILENVCPNCGGGFTNRPTRPRYTLEKNPVKTEEFIKPVNLEVFEKIKFKNKDINPRKR